MDHTHVVIVAIFLFIVEAVTALPGRSALEEYPLIDGHNDLAYNLHNKLQNQIQNFSFDSDLTRHPLFGAHACPSCNTDLVRIKKGRLGAQFWSAFVDCEPRSLAVSKTLEQVDVIRRLIDKYPNDLEFVSTADGITNAFSRRRLASLIGLEGGHSIDGKLALLRQFYALGARYMTLTQACSLPWADSSVVDAEPHRQPKMGLTDFGQKVVIEMNRLGMMVDLSHVSHDVMVKAIEVSHAPVIFSHSSAYAVHPHHRNVKDDVLLKVKSNAGIVMVNFYSEFLANGRATMRDVAKHINHIVDVAGIDHVGIGSDFDGVDRFPQGLEDVSKYPELFDLLPELNATRWTVENLQKLAGRNFYRVFKAVEAVKMRLTRQQPDESRLAESLTNGDGGRGATGWTKFLAFVMVVSLFIK